MNVSISICPTALEFANGDRYDEAALLEAIREYVEARHPSATITCLQVGHRQGESWAKLDGDEEAGAALLAGFFEDHGTDSGLFVTENPAVQMFRPSHRITLPSGEVVEVMLVDGAAYTQAEWEAETIADYECDENGAWSFQGQPFAGAVREIEQAAPAVETRGATT